MKFATSLIFLLVMGCSGSNDQINIIPNKAELLRDIGIYKESKDWNNLYLSCKSYLQYYPAEENSQEIKKIQFDGCKSFVEEGEHKQFLFIPYTVRTRPIDNFLDTIRSYPHESYTVEYIYWLATFLLEEEYTTTAELQFLKIIDRYSDTEYIDEALYQLGLIYFKRFNGLEYSADSLKDSERYFSRIIDEFPDSRFVDNSMELRSKIRELLSQKILASAKFYEFKNNIKGAITYYNEVLLKYPNTPAADESKSAIIRLNKQLESITSEQQDGTK